MKPSFFIMMAAGAALTLSSCSTVANQRKLYWPAQASGPWTQKYHEAQKLPPIPHIVPPDRPAQDPGLGPIPHLFPPKSSVNNQSRSY